MFVTIINDCRDANAFGRQATRAAALFGCPVNLVGVSGELEAAGDLVDALDAAAGRPGVILVNVAPRHGHARKWANGTPFGWFRHGETLVVASVDGLTLSVAKKFGLLESVRLFDIPTVVVAAVRQGVVDAATGERIVGTQFRSFEFLPRVAKWLQDGVELPADVLAATEVPDAPPAVWFVDNFGNCKTTLFPEEYAAWAGSDQATPPRVASLKDVPDGQAAVVVGSSGIGGRRLLEIVVQGGNAAERLSLTSGQVLG